MSLPQRLSDASRSEDIIWDFEFEKNQLALYKHSFYEGRSLNASPHKYNFYGFQTIHQGTPRTTPAQRFTLVFPAGFQAVDQDIPRSILFNNFKQQIIELKNLSKGWDSYNANPPNYDALINSIEILNALFESQLIPTRIMPSVEGGVSFLFIKNTKYADIECDNDGDVFAGMSDRIGEPILWQIIEADEEKSLSASISKIRTFIET